MFKFDSIVDQPQRKIQALAPVDNEEVDRVSKEYLVTLESILPDPEDGAYLVRTIAVTLDPGIEYTNEDQLEFAELYSKLDNDCYHISDIQEFDLDFVKF